MNVITLKIAQSIIEGKDAHVPTVMNVIAAHDRIRMILHPDSGKCVSTNLVILVGSLRVVGDVQANVLAVGYIAASDGRFRARATNTHGRSDCNRKTRCDYQIQETKKKIIISLNRLHYSRYNDRKQLALTD